MADKNGPGKISGEDRNLEVKIERIEGYHYDKVRGSHA